MREFLFRGKTEDGRWAYGSLILAESYCCILESEDEVHPMDYPYLDADLGIIDGKATPVSPKTVGQFTGAMDQFDRKIFEGDIIYYPNGILYEVIWCNEEFRWIIRGINEEDYDDLSNLCSSEIHISGNIHDNPSCWR